MYLKKKATVLISTVIILSLMSILGCLFYKMMKNNNELGNLYNYEKDIYDLDKVEEEILNKFMREINKHMKREAEENNDEADIFSNGGEITIEDSTINYSKEDGKLFLKTYRDKEKNRKREIKYFFKDEKVILVPTYKFEEDTT